MADTKNNSNNPTPGRRLPPAAARAKAQAEMKKTDVESKTTPVTPSPKQPEVVQMPKVDEPVKVVDPMTTEVEPSEPVKVEIKKVEPKEPVKPADPVKVEPKEPVKPAEPVKVEPVKVVPAPTVIPTSTPAAAPIVETAPVVDPAPAVEPAEVTKPGKTKAKVTYENGKIKSVKKVLTKEEKKQRKILKKGKRHYWWRYLLVFFTGIIFTIGAIAGTVVVAATMVTTGQIVQLVGGKPEDYLTEEYKDKTVLQMIMSFANGEIKLDNLQGIRDVTPYVDTLIDSINVELDKAIGFSFDKEELYKQNWNEIGNYIFEELQNGIKLANVLNVKPGDSAVLIYLAYNVDENGNTLWDSPRTLGDLMNNMSSIIDNARIGDLLDVGTEGLLYNLRDVKIGEMADAINSRPLNQIIDIPDDGFPALVYIGKYPINSLNDALENATLGDLLDVGTEGILYNLRDVRIDNIAVEMETRPLNQIIDIPDDGFPALVYLGNYPVNGLNDALENATLGDLIPIEEDSPLYSLRNKTIDEIPEEIKTLKLSEVITIDETSSLVLQNLKDTPINELSDAIDGLLLSQVIEVNADSPKILKTLANTSISDLGSKINNLTIADVVEITPDSPAILRALSTTNINDLGEAIDTLTIDQIFDITEDSPMILKALSEKGATLGNMESVINTLTIGDMVDVGDSLVLNALKDSSLDTLADDVNNLTLSDVVDTTSEDAPMILKSLAGVKINELGDAIHNLKIEEIIEINEDSPMILRALRGTNFEDLSARIESLTMGDIFTDEEIADCIFLSAMGKDTKLDSFADRINELTFVEVFKDSIYEDPNDPSTLKSTWKYLLQDAEGNIRTDYKIAHDMSLLVENMERNFENATLDALYLDGFLTLSDPTILDKKIAGYEIGSLTMAQLIELVSAFAV